MGSWPASRTTRTRWPRSSTRAGSPRSRGSMPIPHAVASGASMRAWCGNYLCHPRTWPTGAPSRTKGGRMHLTTTSLPTCTNSTPRTAVHWTHPPRILSEHLAPLSEPLACLLTPSAVAPPAAVAALGARALLDLTALALEGEAPWPAWLAPHQLPAAERLVGIVARYGGALLAHAVGLGKSYVALGVALALGEPFARVVPAVLVGRWRALPAELGADAPSP